MQARGADGGALAFPMLAQMELSGRAPLSEGTDTLQLTPLTASPLLTPQLFHTSSRDPIISRSLLRGHKERVWHRCCRAALAPQPLSPLSPALPVRLQDSWIPIAINDKVATLLHQDFIFQTHSPSAPRTMSSATQRQGRWRCHQTSSGDPLILRKPTLAPGLHQKIILTGKRFIGIREALSFQCAKQRLVLQPPSSSGETPGRHRDVSHPERSFSILHK